MTLHYKNNKPIGVPFGTTRLAIRKKGGGVRKDSSLQFSSAFTQH